MPQLDSVDSHNNNCFAYLQQLAQIAGVAPIINSLLSKTECANFFAEEYDPSVSYANLYTQFLTALENKIEAQGIVWSDRFDPKAYKQLINTVYENRNQILPHTYERFKGTLATRRLVDSRPEQRVRAELDASTTSHSDHRHTPKKAGSNWERFSSMVSDTFKPMLTTSIPSTRDYRYSALLRQTDRSYPQELRFGTQGQRNEGATRVSPLFREWLRQNKSSDKTVSHVYFNLLGYDRTGYEGTKERNLSLALHGLEKDHDNIVVITLPADKGLMEHTAFKHTKENPALTMGSAFAEMRDIAKGKRTRVTQDFVISPRAKQLLYGTSGDSYDAVNESEVVATLLDNSFKAMGLDINKPDQPLSPAQQQAVWFHFTKYELPNYVLDTLKPDSWNTSCKDAIDRGGVASAYKNLISSFQSPIPMSRDEFEQGLHAAAALVKGRGLNHHYEIIWNAIDKYVDANFEALAADPNKEWLIHWRNDNTPHDIARLHSTFKKVLRQNDQLLQNKLNDLRVEPNSNTQHIQAVQHAQAVLAEVTNGLFDLAENPKPTSGKRLLLEVVTHSTQMALRPDASPAKDLAMVLGELNKSPSLGKIRGAFKVFVGFMTSFTRWGKELMNKGFDTLERYNQDNTSTADIKSRVTHMKHGLLEMRARASDDDNSEDEEDVRTSHHGMSAS